MPSPLAFADSGKGGGGGKGHDGDHGGGGGNSGGKGNSGGGGNDSGHGNSSGSGKGKDSGSDDDSGGDDNNGGSGDDDGAAGPGGSVPSDRMSGGHDRIVHHEIVVTGVDAELAAFARSKGFRVRQTENLAELDLTVARLEVPQNLSATQARDLIARQFPDAIVDFNHLYQPQTSLSLPATDYAVKAVHWSPRLQGCGTQARLGLIDTAVDWSLPILAGARHQTARFLEADIAAAPPQHGTGIATLLVGQKDFGLLPGTELYSAGIFGLDGEGVPVASATSFAAALNWLLTNKVATINVSLSGPPDRLMELAVKRAQQRGAELVAAVGNDGTIDVPRFPAAYAGVIGVTAVDQGGQIFSGANRGAYVAVAAPGVDLLIPGQPSAGGGTADRLVTGTSFAAPYVTAALASYGNDPARLLAGTVDLGQPGPDPVFGRGLVQAPNVCIGANPTN